MGGRAAALDNWLHEQAAIYLYRRLELREGGAAGKLFAALASESAKQAALWEAELGRSGAPPGAWRPGLRVRLVGWMIGRLGAGRMLPVLAAMKVRGLALYRGSLVVPPAAEEATVAAPPAEALPAASGEESWHRAASRGGALRAAVFGANDGLVSNASLILGVAGADPDPRVVLLAGVAGMIAGGFSMATGEYISVKTQRELLEHQLELERNEMLEAPEEEIEELTIIYRAKGLPAADAASLARRIVADPEHGLETLAREELGLDPKSLASPIGAALASFVSFAAGAFVPLLPYLLAGGSGALLATVVVTEVALLSVGALMSLFTGRSAVLSALRMALLGSAAGAATYAIGKLLGVSVS